MPNPTRSDVHVNRPLTNISVAYMQSADKFVAGRVFPSVPVSNKSDLYFEFNRGDFNRDQAKKRAPGAESAGGDFRLTTGNYSCDVWAIHKDVADQIRANADSPLNLDRSAARYVAYQLMIRREVDWAAQFFAGGKWTRDWDGSATTPGVAEVLQWNDASSTPIEDMRAAMTDVQLNSGFRPNVLVVGQQVWDVLVDHADIVDRIKYGQTAGQGPAHVTRGAVASLLEIDEVLVMGAIQNSAGEALAESNAYIGGKKALLCYRNSTPAIEEPSAGYSFVWTGFVGAQDGMRTKMFRMDHLESDRVEGELAIDHKLVSAQCGAFFDTIVA